MGESPNVVFLIRYVQSGKKIANNKTLQNKYADKRSFYSCNNGAMDYLRYVDEGTKNKNLIMEQDYVGYSGNSEKSFGVFDYSGLLNKDGRTKLRNKLRETDSTIWHGIISFEESFGNRYCSTYEDAYKMMRIEFPKFLRSAGFNPAKITWFAGLHENTDNLHIHYSFFENEPSRYAERGKGLQFSEGRISSRHFEEFKIACEQRLTDISSQLKLARKDVVDLSRSLLFSNQNYLKYKKDLERKLKHLACKLPKSGRLSYDSENMKDLKPDIKQIIHSIFKTNKLLYLKFEDYCCKVRQKDSCTLKMLKRSKIDESKWQQYLKADTYLEDIYRRLGNHVINMVRVVRNKEKHSKNNLATKRMRKRTVSELLSLSLKIKSFMEIEAVQAFREYLEKLEEENETFDGAIEHEL